MQHLDEGTIHAWLDGALTAEEAARVERHTSECAECAAVVAEARGLVAGASRVLSTLDDVTGVVPATGEDGAWRVQQTLQARSVDARRRAKGGRFWSRPAALAAAASVVLMAGSAVVLKRAGEATSRAVDTSAAIASPTTDEAVSAAGPVAGTTSRATGAVSATGVTGGTAARRAVDGARRDTSAKFAAEGIRRAPAAVAPAADPPVAQRAEKEAPAARPTAAPAAALGDVARKAAVPATPLEKRSDVAAYAATDTAAAAPRAAAGRAAPVRTGTERMIPMTGAEALRRSGRVDTVYQLRSDTVIVEPPAPPGLRGGGRAGSATRAFPLTGCYEVVEGGLPRSITLTTTPVWSGAAEQRFVATAPGAIGYWSQPSSGDVHLMIAGALVTARIDASTGELRGKVHRGGKSERFVARRGCR